MAMNPSSMTSSIESAIDQLNDPGNSLSSFYKALCKYVEDNAQVIYAWSGIQPGITPVTDPTVVINAKIKTAGSISLSNATSPSAACAKLSNALNTAASTWIIQFPSGFALTPCFVIPTINITPSGATNKHSAWLAVCGQIINGIKQATPTAIGSHGGFLAPPGGGASFTSIL